MNVVVVHPSALTDDRCVRLDHGVARLRQDFHRPRAYPWELVLVVRLSCFVVAVLIGVFTRVKPEHSRQLLTGAPVLGQCHVDGDLEIVNARHLDSPPLCVCDTRSVIDVVGDLPQVAGGHVAQV